MKKKIALLGFGVVGAGCADVLFDNISAINAKTGCDIEVKYILDLKDFPESRFKDKIIHDINIILNDPEVELVAEMMGGSHPALEFSLSAMQHGKHVVTSNKEVVSTHGLELLECAKENNVYYMFEASVGGGIPIINAIDTALVQNNISEIDGILNGTTNYILTRMNTAGVSFNSALAEAQKKGYAEANPAADVDGIDACRKICILSALAFGKLPDPEKVHAEGIRNISAFDVQNAANINASVKLIGRTFMTDDGIYAYVCPMAVPSSDPLSNVSDVFNAVKVNGDAVGEVMLYGRGAGKLPTASAVVSDIVNILTGRGIRYSWQAVSVLPFEKAKQANCIMIEGDGDITDQKNLKKASGNTYITEPMDENEYVMFEAGLTEKGYSVKSRLRIL